MDDSLPKKEQSILSKLQKRLSIKKRKTDMQLVIGMVGLVGSGKSDVAVKLAPKIGATVIESLDIFRELQKAKLGYDHKRHIERLLTLYVLEQGGSVILTSDHIDLEKRQTIERLADAMDARYEFIRTHADLDVMMGNIADAAYGKEDFFVNATSSWPGKRVGAVVKAREMARRIPYHYSWSEENGGEWKLKRPLLELCCEIDTGTKKSFDAGIALCVEKLTVL